MSVSESAGCGAPRARVWRDREPARPAIGDWQLERYRLGELPVGELDTIRAALATAGSVEREAGLDRSD
jgi:hypothetical protein